MRKGVELAAATVLSVSLLGCSPASSSEKERNSVVARYCSATMDVLQPPVLPDCTGGEIVQHRAYTVCYDEQYEQARWAMYPLTSDMATSVQVERMDNFKADPEVDTGSAHPDDYKKSGYDRGHLVPAADMQWSEEAMKQSFFMSNMSPQTPNLNRGDWKTLERNVRNWAVENGKLHVITGPIFDENPKTLGENGVAVPDKFFKVILDQECPRIKASGFIMANTPQRTGEQGSADNMVSIDAVESITGINFFSNLPQDLQKEVESAVNRALWY